MKRMHIRPAGAVHVGHFGHVVDLVPVKNYNEKMDRTKHAMKAGMRKTANPHMYHGRTVRKSTVYYENRANRADKNGTIKPFGKGAKSKKTL